MVLVVVVVVVAGDDDDGVVVAVAVLVMLSFLQPFLCERCLNRILLIGDVGNSKRDVSNLRQTFAPKDSDLGPPNPFFIPRERKCRCGHAFLLD